MKKSKVPHKLIPGDEREMTQTSVQQTASTSYAGAEFEEDKFDKQFWLEVGKKAKNPDKSWNRAMDEVRAERLIKKHGKNALLVIILKWPRLEKYKKNPELIPSLEYLISRLTEIILELDKETKFGFFRVDAQEKASQPTLLHLAAKQDFLHVTRCLVNHSSGLMYLYTRKGKKSALPVELALRKRKDDTAAYLISQMKYDWVQNLFLCNNNEEPSIKFYFGDIISYRDPKTNEYSMKKTVLAVLDKLINPRWPYLPERRDEDESNEDIQRALESVPDDPMNYDFNYHILEADENGREPKIEVATEFNKNDEPTDFEKIVNPYFNARSVSCLRRIADSDNKEAIQHPVVRMLVARKWKGFAHKWFCVKAALYWVFLTVLSFALLYGSTREDPTQYNGSADKLRAFCEIACLVCLMLQFFDEIGELAREKGMYFKIGYNCLDVFGIVLTFLVIPLRFAEVKAQWSIAAIGYVFNFLRLFKYSNVSRNICLYTTTLVNIIKKDITCFLAFFSVIFIGFCGALFMALKVDDMQDSFSNFGWLMLAGFRALVETQNLEDNYQKFGWLTILLLLIYMGAVIVVLLNILIAQLSDTYSEAKSIAKIQYTVDTMRIVTRLEYSRFPFWNLRVKKYVDGAWISDEDLAKEILEYNDGGHPWETGEARITSVREIMRKVIRKGKEKDPWESIDDKLTKLTAMMEKAPESE